MQDRQSFYCTPLGVLRALTRPSRYAGSPEPLLLTFVSCEGSDETE